MGLAMRRRSPATTASQRWLYVNFISLDDLWQITPFYGLWILLRPAPAQNLLTTPSIWRPGPLRPPADRRRILKATVLKGRHNPPGAGRFWAGRWTQA